jgi:plastocyanin
MKLRSIVVPGLAAAVVAVAALVFAHGSGKSGSHASSAVSSASNVAITIQDFAYSPASLTVKVGTTLTITNRDMTAHTLSANDGAFDSGTIQPGQTVRVTVHKAGTFPYHCEFHAFMTGTLKVVG